MVDLKKVEDTASTDSLGKMDARDHPSTRIGGNNC